MHYVIAQEYQNLEDEFKKLVRGEYTPEKVYCNRRNTVELVNVGGRRFVLKKYKRVGFVKGLIYTFFRKSKARRAYEYASILRNAGIGTPREAAYFEISSGGIFHDGYFLSEYVDWPVLAEPYFKWTFPDKERARVMEGLALFVSDLHKAGIVPRDFNLTNILYQRQNDGNYKFQILDINRMSVGRTPGLAGSMKAFHQMWAQPADYVTLVTPYAYQRGFDIDRALYTMLKFRLRFLRRKKLKDILLRRH